MSGFDGRLVGRLVLTEGERAVALEWIGSYQKLWMLDDDTTFLHPW